MERIYIHISVKEIIMTWMSNIMTPVSAAYQPCEIDMDVPYYDMQVSGVGHMNARHGTHLYSHQCQKYYYDMDVEYYDTSVSGIPTL